MKPMKTREVTKALLAMGCTRIEGGRHTVWTCPCGKHKVPVGRHTETSAGVVADVIKKMACLRKGWLQ